jgi:hypothetical protein
VVKIAFMWNYYSWETFLGRSATPTSRLQGPPLPLRVAEPDEKPEFLSYLGSIFNCISRVLSWHFKKSVSLPPRKISSSPWSVKDDLGLQMPGVYSIPCECGPVHIGETSC